MNTGWNVYGSRSTDPGCGSSSGSGKMMPIPPDPHPQHWGSKALSLCKIYFCLIPEPEPDVAEELGWVETSLLSLPQLLCSAPPRFFLLTIFYLPNLARNEFRMVHYRVTKGLSRIHRQHLFDSFRKILSHSERMYYMKKSPMAIFQPASCTKWFGYASPHQVSSTLAEKVYRPTIREQFWKAPFYPSYRR